MKRTLLISSSDQGAAALGDMLRAEGFQPITVSYTAYGAKQEAEQKDFDLICINAPLADENGIELSRSFAAATGQQLFEGLNRMWCRRKMPARSATCSRPTACW